MKAETRILLDGLMFPEGPRWHEGRFWFTDQHAQRIVRMDAEGQASTVAELDDLPGGLGWLPDGSLLVVSMTRRQILRLTGAGLALYADLSTYASFHCNDMVVDPAGRCYVGNFGYDVNAGAPQRPAEIVCVEPGGRIRVAADGLIFPNGSVIDVQTRRFIVAETFASRLTVFDWAESGDLGRPRLWADTGDGNPDGICMDAEGAIWAACPNLGQVLHLNLSGEITRRVSTHAAPYACMLAGKDRTSLYVCSARSHVPAEARAWRSGCIETLEVDVPGAGLP